jgi:hypothetical protein
MTRRLAAMPMISPAALYIVSDSLSSMSIVTLSKTLIVYDVVRCYKLFV